MATVTFLEPGSDATQDTTFWTFGFGASPATVNDGGNDATGSIIQSATDQSHTGGRSIKANMVGTDGVCYLCSPNATFADAGTRLSFAIRWSAIPTVNNTIFLAPQTASDANTTMAFALNTAGKITVLIPFSGNVVTGTTVLSAGTWYRVSVSFVVTTSTSYTINLYINGTLELTITNANGGTILTGTSMAEFGSDLTGTAGFQHADNLSMWYDDIYIDNGSDLADPGGGVADTLRVTAKRPFANGTLNQLTTQIGAGGSGYGSGHAPQVNERPLSQTNGWSGTVSGGDTREEYNVEGLSVGDVNLTGATIQAVQGWFFGKSSAANTDRIMVDGTATNIAQSTTPALVTFNSPNPTTFPAGTGTDIGLTSFTNGEVLSLYECGILVAYLPGAILNPGCFPPRFTRPFPYLPSSAHPRQGGSGL